jgi:hypothetical protein
MQGNLDVAIKTWLGIRAIDPHTHSRESRNKPTKSMLTHHPSLYCDIVRFVCQDAKSSTSWKFISGISWFGWKSKKRLEEESPRARIQFGSESRLQMNFLSGLCCIPSHMLWIKAALRSRSSISCYIVNARQIRNFPSSFLSIPDSELHIKYWMPSRLSGFH